MSCLDNSRHLNNESALPFFLVMLTRTRKLIVALGTKVGSLAPRTIFYCHGNDMFTGLNYGIDFYILNQSSKNTRKQKMLLTAQGRETNINLLPCCPCFT